jgi:choice-of-anchor C domain-containing protein
MKKLLCAIALALLLVGQANASIVVNGSFEGTTNVGAFTTLAVGSTAINGWTVTRGSVDWIGTYWTPADGSKSLDMNAGNLGGIQQTLTGLTPSQKYVVTFELAGNPANQTANQNMKILEVLVGNQSEQYSFNVTGKTLTNMGWQEETFVFTADSSTAVLTFKSIAPANAYGPALDKVDVTAVPEPATIAIWSILGVVGIAVGCRRKVA